MPLIRPSLQRPSSIIEEVIFVTAAVFCWAVLVFFVALSAHSLFSHSPQAISMVGAFRGNMKLVTPLVRWDSLHYLRIANQGYKDYALPGLPAFFPAYPLLIRWLSWPLYRLMQKSFAILITGTVANFVFLVMSLLIVKKIYEMEFGPSGAWRAAGLILASPYAFYFLAFYAESMFLFFTVGAFWAAFKRKWWLAGLLAGVASGTRLQGIFLAPALAAEYMDAREWQWKKIKPDCLWLLLCPFGLVSYLIYLGGLQAYLTQAGVWSQRVLNWNILTPYINYFTQVVQNNKIDFSDTINVMVSLVFIFFLIYGWTRLKISYRIYLILCVIVPLLTTVVQAVGRYYTVLFPLCIIASLKTEKKPMIAWGLAAAGFMLGGILIARFTTGYWVA